MTSIRVLNVFVDESMLVVLRKIYGHLETYFLFQGLLVYFGYEPFLCARFCFYNTKHNDRDAHCSHYILGPWIIFQLFLLCLDHELCRQMTKLLGLRVLQILQQGKYYLKKKLRPLSAYFQAMQI